MGQDTKIIENEWQRFEETIKEYVAKKDIERSRKMFFYGAWTLMQELNKNPANKATIMKELDAFRLSIEEN